MYISRSSAFLRCNLNTFIVFQSFRAILLLNTSEVSFLTKGSCIFAKLNLIALNFPQYNVQRKLFQNISKKVRNVLRIFTFIFLALVIWQLNAFCITVFFRGDWYNYFCTSFYSFYSTVYKHDMFTKLFYIIRILKHFSVITCISFFRIIFRIFYYFMFGYFFFLVFALFLCLFVNALHGFYLFTYFNDYNLYFNDYKVPPFSYSYTLSQYPCGDCLTHRGKFHILKNLPGWDLALNSSPGR